MTPDTAARQLAELLRAENACLAARDPAAATRLLPEKQAAVAALQAALPQGAPAGALLTELKSLAQRNRLLLADAIEVQGRILEMVAHAARAAAAVPGRYGARGAAMRDRGALAVALRA